jgi:hypothetical protein
VETKQAQAVKAQNSKSRGAPLPQPPLHPPTVSRVSARVVTHQRPSRSTRADGRDAPSVCNASSSRGTGAAALLLVSIRSLLGPLYGALNACPVFCMWPFRLAITGINAGGPDVNGPALFVGCCVCAAAKVRRLQVFLSVQIRRRLSLII